MSTLIESLVYGTTTQLDYPVWSMELPETVQQGQPVVIIQIIDTEHGHFLSGKSNGVAVARVQFTCLSYQIGDVESMAEAIRNCWHGYQGEIQGITIMAAWKPDDPIEAHPRLAGTDNFAYECMMDMFFRYRE